MGIEFAVERVFASTTMRYARDSVRHARTTLQAGESATGSSTIDAFERVLQRADASVRDTVAAHPELFTAHGLGQARSAVDQLASVRGLLLDARATGSLDPAIAPIITNQLEDAQRSLRYLRLRRSETAIARASVNGAAVPEWAARPAAIQPAAAQAAPVGIAVPAQVKPARAARLVVDVVPVAPLPTPVAAAAAPVLSPSAGVRLVAPYVTASAHGATPAGASIRARVRAFLFGARVPTTPRPGVTEAPREAARNAAPTAAVAPKAAVAPSAPVAGKVPGAAPVDEVVRAAAPVAPAANPAAVAVAKAIEAIVVPSAKVEKASRLVKEVVPEALMPATLERPGARPLLERFRQHIDTVDTPGELAGVREQVLKQSNELLSIGDDARFGRQQVGLMQDYLRQMDRLAIRRGEALAAVDRAAVGEVPVLAPKAVDAARPVANIAPDAAPAVAVADVAPAAPIIAPVAPVPPAEAALAVEAAAAALPKLDEASSLMREVLPEALMPTTLDRPGARPLIHRFQELIDTFDSPDELARVREQILGRANQMTSFGNESTYGAQQVDLMRSYFRQMDRLTVKRGETLLAAERAALDEVPVLAPKALDVAHPVARIEPAAAHVPAAAAAPVELAPVAVEAVAVQPTKFELASALMKEVLPEATIPNSPGARPLLQKFQELVTTFDSQDEILQVRELILSRIKQLITFADNPRYDRQQLSLMRDYLRQMDQMAVMRDEDLATAQRVLNVLTDTPNIVA